MSPPNIVIEESAIPKKDKSKVFFKLPGLDTNDEGKSFVQLVQEGDFKNLFNGSYKHVNGSFY